MAHTEKCRGCGFENKCDYITCEIQRLADVRAKAIDEFADKMIIMMPGHKADILMIAEQLKKGVKNE